MSQERLKQTIERVNASLAAQIEHAREALSGAQPFEAGHVEQLRSTIEEMTAITARSGKYGAAIWKLPTTWIAMWPNCAPCKVSFAS